jgi:multidrug efflux pump subunit AcrB
MINYSSSPETEKALKEKLEQAEADESRSLFGFFIRKYRVTYLLILLIIILGAYSLMTLPREANPEVEIPVAVVSTIFPGANPTDTEELVTEVVEEEVENLEGLNRYTSSSGQGTSIVVVEFSASADLDESYRKLREAVDRVTGLPDAAEDPAVMEISLSDMPIVTYSLVGDYSTPELTDIAKGLEKEFTGINNVSKVEILGSLNREFKVIVDPQELSHYGVSLSAISGAIARSNFNLPAGNIQIDAYEYGVRVEGRIQEAEEIKNIPITVQNGSPVYIRDVAAVIDGYEEQSTKSRIGASERLPRNTISLQIYKRTGGNILEIVEESQNIVNNAQANEVVPADVEIVKTNDNSVFIKEDLARLSSSGLQTMGLILVLLLVILSFRGALITALSVPLAFLMTFVFLSIMDLTLNSLVLFSLVLSLGLMVDNSIIIIEGINEYVTKFGKSVRQAALLSVWNFKWPVIAGTSTTIGAFLPILLVSGIMGEFISVLPKTVAAALGSSLFVALIVLPTMAANFIKVPAKGGHRNKRRHRFINHYLDKIRARYASVLYGILPSKKKRRAILAAAWLLFFLAISLPIAGIMRIEMFPPVDVDYFVVNIKLPNGTVIERTDEVTARVEKVVAELPEVDNYVTNVGTGMSLGSTDPSQMSGGSSPHQANITVNLVDDDERERASYEIAQAMRERLARVQDAEVTVEELSAGPPSGDPVEIRLFGQDLRELQEVSTELQNILENIGGVVNIEDNLQESTGEFTFAVNKQQASYYGLTVADIASNLRQAVYGADASTVNLGDEEINIRLKYSESAFTGIEDLKSMAISTPTGGSVALSQIAQIELKPSLLSISHRDGERAVAISGSLAEGAYLQDILTRFQEEVDARGLPEDVSMQIGGEAEEIQQSFQEIFLSMILAVIIIAFILVLQFNSFRQPFIILFALPLAIIGVIAGLNLLMLPFSFTVFIGLVALAGIVVNDAIVLIDAINKNLTLKMDFNEAIIEGGKSRLQPVLLTTVTTIAGILPLVFADELWRGLAIAVIFGLLFSTLLTLIMVPIYYVSICKGEKGCGR